MDKGDHRGTGEREREEEVAQAILAYLAEHPRAMDSLEGIAEWWLARVRVRQDVATIAKVLSALTQEGVLEEVNAGGQARYRLKRG